MKELPIQQQINVLEQAKSDLISGRTLYTCNAIKWTIVNKLKLEVGDSSNCVKFIPLATPENALYVCKKYKLKQPVSKYVRGGWWLTDSRGLKSRVAFVNWMIKQLKAQL